MADLPLDMLDLSDADKEIYKHLLNRPDQSASAIASALDLNRSFVYDRLDKLENKGLIQPTTKPTTTTYKASSPSYIGNLLQQQVDQAKQKIEQYKPKRSHTKPDIETFTAKRPVQASLNDLIEQTNRVAIYGNLEILHERMKDYMSVWHAKRVEQTEQTRALLLTPSKIKNSTVKRLQRKTTHNQTIFVSDDRVQIVWWADGPASIILHGKDVRTAYHQFFEKAWEENIQIYDGVNGLQTAWMRLIKDNVSEIKVYGHSHQLAHIYGRSFGDKWQQKRLQKDISHRVIGKNNQQTKDYINSKDLQHKDMKARFLDENILGPTCVATNGEIALTFLYTSDNYQVIADTKTEAINVYKNRFEDLWEQARSLE